MKYMLLIYTDEGSQTEGEREQCFAESTRLTHELHKQGKYLALRPCTLWPRRPAFACVPEMPDHGRPVRRNARAARRLLHGRRR